MHAYFPALNSYPSLLGDMLADGINCLGFTWVMNYFKNIIQKLNTYIHKGAKLAIARCALPVF